MNNVDAVLALFQEHRAPWPTPGAAACSCGTVLRRTKANGHNLGAAHDQHLAEVISEAVAGDERARIVWWLRAAAEGPGRVNHSKDYLLAIREMADAIEQHPERFAEAPTGRRA